MISPQEFLERWNKDIYGLVSFEEEGLNEIGITTFAKFLLIVGLPVSQKLARQEAKIKVGMDEKASCFT
ncbi:MAG: hypothetical protein ACQEWW_22410 [Bacillota bacterium]